MHTRDSRGLFTPDSLTWKIHSDPSMAVGGIRALLEQALHPVAMDGVAKNSNFREDAWGRLQRTGDYVTTLTFGSQDEAEALAARVRKVHTTLGLDDPHYLLWVHMAMVDSFLDIALRSGMKLSDTEQDGYIEEMVLFAELVGIPRTDVPVNRQQLNQYFMDIAPELTASEDAKRAAIFLTIPPMKTLVRFATPAAPAWASLTLLAGSALPSWAKKLYGWPTLPGQNIATDISLKAIKNSLSILPDALLSPPVYKAALVRWNIEKAS